MVRPLTCSILKGCSIKQLIALVIKTYSNISTQGHDPINGTFETYTEFKARTEMPHYSQQQANLLSRFIKNNKNENMQTKLEDCETVLVFANDNAKDSYVMLSRLDEIHVQGSRSKVYDIQQDLNKAIWREHNNNISEVNKWFKAKNKEITNDTQNITMQIQ